MEKQTKSILLAAVLAFAFAGFFYQLGELKRKKEQNKIA